ncbi:hypothetical protein PAMP_019188 [Pampus punctatissimus]
MEASVCFEDDEPPCVEEIEYSTDYPTLKGTDLDSDVNINMTSADGEEEGDEGHKGAQQRQGGVVQSQQSSMKSRLFPHLITEASIETLNEKRNMCNGSADNNLSITSNKALSQMGRSIPSAANHNNHSKGGRKAEMDPCLKAPCHRRMYPPHQREQCERVN